MEEVMLAYAYSYECPGKQVLVCDINDGRTFADPLIVFQIPDYDPDNINHEGLYAIGGKIDVETLMKSYSWGIFPWFPFKADLTPYWYCPQQRYVLFPDNIHVGHTLRNLLNKGKYSITINQDFRRVIHNCRTVGDRNGHPYAWLSDEIESVFIRLNELGYAKSIEVWEDDELVGGFYGFWQNGVLQGESMFSFRPSASQIGLVLLCKNPYIEGRKIKLIDTQFETPVFKHLGAQYIPYALYREIMVSDC